MNRIGLIGSLREAGGNGTFIHAYDQGADDGDRPRQMDITESGGCFGVSVNWLKRKKTALEFWQWHGTNEGGSAICSLMAISAVRDQVMSSFDDVDWTERTDLSVKKVSLSKVAHSKRIDAAATVVTLGRDIVDGPGKYAACHIDDRAGGGHTTAAIIDAGAVTFMDPNAGEVSVSKKAEILQRLPVIFQKIGAGALRRADVEKYA